MTARPVPCSFLSAQNILFSCVVSSRVLSVPSFVVASTVVHKVDNLHCVTLSHLVQNKTVSSLSSSQLHTKATPCMDDHQFKEEENESVGDLCTVCPQIVLKCLYLARIGRPDFYGL